MLIVQVYVDAIIFGASNQVLYEDFTSLMWREFEMSMMGEHSFFLGLQIQQAKDRIAISQAECIKELQRNTIWLKLKLQKHP